MFKCLSPCLSSQAILLCENWMLTVRSGKITDWQRYAIQSPLCYLLAFSYWMVEFHLVTLTWFLKVNLYFITNLWIWRKEIIYRYSISLSSEKWFRLYTWSEHPLFSFNSSHTWFGNRSWVLMLSCCALYKLSYVAFLNTCISSN